MRITSAGHAFFAATMIGLGILGLVKGDFSAVWQPVPKTAPARDILIYLCAAISIGVGVGLLWKRSAPIAARVLLASLVLWFLLWRVRPFFLASLVESTWSAGATLAMMAAAWVLCAPLATGKTGLRIAHVLYGLALLPFGYAHFAYIQHTADMVPSWLPWRLGWAYFTGVTFIAASLAIVTGVCARLAATLSAVQIALFGLLVWVPMMLSVSLNAFQQGEVATTVALTAAGWVVAESYRTAPLL
jgi:uncharacterized membrane protein